MEQRQETVLYVDDDEVSRYAFAILLREAGFDVTEAATGSEALRLAEAKPDLVILDVNLPDISGLEVCRRIKAHPSTTAIPVMHMSGVYVTTEQKAHALDEGADVYLTKPVEPRELIAQAKALLRLHQAEEKARAAARQWQATFDAINDGVCLLDEQGRALRCNRALAQILRKSPQEILGATAHELTASRGGPGEAQAYVRMLETRQRETAELPLGDRWLHTVADPMLAEDGALAGAVYILTDVTERKRLEEQLQQKQKMEAMGQLAGGVAHDFNNMLTAITGNVSLLLAGTPEQSPDRELLLAAERAAWRAAELTRQLLGLSRRTTPERAPTHLPSCLDEVVSMVRRTIDPRVTVEVRSAPDLWTVQANSGQINQVVMNLCLNARDAMPEGGHLLLEAENVTMDEAQARLREDARPGELVRLRVRDTGHGIPAEVLLHIFEPFFTTKEVGKGTGLGLATTYSIIRQHQGWIECSSAIGSGSCFDVYLPRAATAPTVTAAPSGPPVPRGSETILLADDNEALRSLGRTILSRYGYEVLLAEDGQQAVEVYQREKDRIALVILDLRMPRLSGRDALRQLRGINPRARVLLASGYPAEEGTEPSMEGALGFLAKPYSERDLATMVRRALDGEGPEGPPPGGPSNPIVPEPPPGGPAEAPVPGDRAEGGRAEAGPDAEWSCRSGLPKAAAEQLLDWLEANGYQRRELNYEEGTGYTIRWQEEALSPRGRRCRRRYRGPCPRCGSTSPPYMKREMPLRSWVLAAFGILLWPLLVIGILLREDVWRCWDCHRVLGRGRRLTLGR